MKNDWKEELKTFGIQTTTSEPGYRLMKISNVENLIESLLKERDSQWLKRIEEERKVYLKKLEKLQKTLNNIKELKKITI